MSTGYTKVNVDEIDDVAPKFGMEEVGQVRPITKTLGGELVGASFYRLSAGKRHGFGHKHEAAEEMYMVVEGSGRIKLDDEILDLTALDMLRVAPEVIREFEAGPDGLTFLAFGNHVEGDGELIRGWWPQE